MNEIKHIHLGRQQFTLALDAHAALRAYLDAIAKQLGDDKEVLEEVELRMAELLGERGITAEKVVLLKDVDYLKEQLGKPQDFAEKSDEDEQPVAESGESRRLYRDTEHGMIAGVSAGIANYVGIDPIIVRLIFVALTFAGASGILIYVLLWLLVPEAKTTSEKLHMRGKAVTVNNLKKAVERADVPGAARRTQGVLVPFINTVGKVILTLIGLPLAIISGVAILWTMITAGYFLLDGAKVSGQVIAPFGAHEVTAFVCGVIAVVTVLLSMLLVGVAMVRRRWQLPAWGVAALVGIFFLSASIGGALAADSVQRIHDRVIALRHTQTVRLASFDQAALNGHDTRFIFVPDKQTYVEYRYFGVADTKAIKTSVKNNVLSVDTDDVSQLDSCNIFCIHTGPDLQVYIHAPQLTSVNVSGSEANFYNQGALTQAGMTLTAADNAFASLDQAYPVTAVLHDNTMGSRQLVMTFAASAQFDDGVSLDSQDNQGIVSFNRVGELNVVNDRTCDESDPYVFVMNGVNKLQLNGKDVPSGDSDYENLRSPDQNSLYNCVVLRAPQLPTLPQPYNMPGMKYMN